MPGFKESNVALGITIQPTPGVYNEPTTDDLIAVSAPENGSDPISADDPTLTGSMWASPRQFLGRRGRVGATFALRGPGGTEPPAAGDWVPGRILQAAGFTEIRNDTAISAAAQAGGTTSSIVLDAGQSATDDFYMGFPIQHASIGTGRVKGTSMIRDYDGASKRALLCETVMAAITGGNFTIPPFLGYVLSAGNDIPLLSAKLWRHRKAYLYRDCAINSFAINIPTNNEQTTDLTSIEFGMVGVPMPSVDELSPPLPTSLLSPVPPVKAGKFALNGIKIGNQSMRIEFGLEAGAPPNVNFDAGQEAYELMSGSRTVNLDINEQLVAALDIDALVDSQAQVPIVEGWGSQPGQSFMVSVANALLDPFSPQGRNGFVGLAGGAVPNDVERAIALAILY